MANWKGTPVPNSGTIENVYFNTNLSINEVVAILDTLELVPVDENGGLGYIPYADSRGISFLIYKNNTNRWYFNYVINNNTSYFWSSKEGYVEGVVNFPLELNSQNIVEMYASQMGQTMQNDKISSLFSITPFEQEEVTLDSWAEDIADAIREKKGTTDLIPRLNFAQEIRDISTGTDTSDATATSSDLLLNKTAYVNDEKVTGTIETYSGEFEGGEYETFGINGIIKQYQVLAGENINAGDFVEYINSVKKEIGGYKSAWQFGSCVLLESNKVFIAHSGNSSSCLYGTIVTIDNDTMTATSTKLNANSNSCVYGTSCILLENNKVFISHCYDGTNKYLYGTIVTISGTTMTVVSSTQLETSGGSYFSSSILLENNKVFIAHRCTSSGYLYGTIVTIDGATMTVVSSTQLYGVSFTNYPSCVLLENNKVFIGFSCGDKLYGTIVTIDGDTMTAVTVNLITDSYSSNNSSPKCVLLESNKVFIAHCGNSSKHLYGTIVTIDNDTMTAVSSIKLSSSSCSYCNCILLENNKVFIAHYLNYGTIVTIDGTTMTAVSMELAPSTFLYPYCVLLESNKVFISYYESSSDRYLAGAIYIGNKVKPYESNILGIALTNGAGGDVIDVVVPDTTT